jgi:uncharacterized protein YbjT (DUF2867 family)
MPRVFDGRFHAWEERSRISPIDAAREAGVERIVYLSFLGAAPRASFTLARQHFATEEESEPRRSGIPSCVRACTRISCRI